MPDDPRIPSFTRGKKMIAADMAALAQSSDANIARPACGIPYRRTPQGTVFMPRIPSQLPSSATNRFPNQIRRLSATKDKAWAIANGGTTEGTDPVSLFLIAINDAITDSYTAQCFVVEPNRMLAEIADASPAAPTNNSGIYLIPAPTLITIPTAYFAEWFYIGIRFDFDADDNTYVGTLALVHPDETVVSGSDIDLSALETYSAATDTSRAEFSCSYIATGSRTAILGRVFLPSSNGTAITGTPIIEQNILGVVKLWWNIAAKIPSFFPQATGDTVDFKIYPQLVLLDGLEPISSVSDFTHYSFFAPNYQIYQRPKILVLKDDGVCKITLDATGGTLEVDTTDSDMAKLKWNGLTGLFEIDGTAGGYGKVKLDITKVPTGKVVELNDDVDCPSGDTIQVLKTT